MEFPFFGKKKVHAAKKDPADDGPEVVVIRRERNFVDAESIERLHREIIINNAKWYLYNHR